MQGFDASSPPFDRLIHQEVEELRAALDIEYYPPGERIVSQGRGSDNLHVLIKGAVESRDGDTILAVLGANDSFDSRAVVHGAAGEDFIAAQETLCYLIPRELVLDLVRRNAAFAAFFYAEVSRKLEAFAQQRSQVGIEGVLRARVQTARHGPAVFIDGSATIEEAGHRMRDNDINALFVHDQERTGVVTGTNLSKAVVLRRLPLETPVRDICRFEVISVLENDFIYEALLLMTRHDKRRLAVQSGNGSYSGFLEDIDILGLFAGNSQLIPGRIERARSLEDLASAATDIQSQVERLHRQGIKVEIVAEITSDLNRRLFRRLFDMLALPSIQEHGCLLLMGSEGRGEQTVRTDQDNALLLSVEVAIADLDRFRTAFAAALESFGFPPCLGNVMVSNPIWSQPVDGFVRQLEEWVRSKDEQAAMNLAIFFDSAFVAGRPALLDSAKKALVELMRGEAVLLSRFANLVETFATPNLGVLSTIMASVGAGPEEIDLKRAGIFPIVHGVRTFALEKGLLMPSTVGRVEALVEGRSLEPSYGQELISALRVLMELRLRSQLRALQRGAMHLEPVVRLHELSTVDRDILRDALRVVRQFRELLRVRYKLDAF